MNYIAFDVEAFDPNLGTKGDGALRSNPSSPDYDGSCLLMCAWHDGERGEACCPGTESWDTLKLMLADPNVAKVFHNGIYDLSWLALGAGLEINGDCHDTMTRAAYIDEYQDLGLDECCKALGVAGKNKDETIEKWYRDNIEDVRLVCLAHGRPFKRSDAVWKHSKFLIDSFPSFRDTMASYCIQDAKATRQLFHAQAPLMQPFYSAYMVDVRLTPLVLDLKRFGVLVDRDRMDALSASVAKDYADSIRELDDVYGIDEDTLESPKRLGQRMNEMGVHSPVKTPRGAESWGVGALNRIAHPAVRLILEARGYKKLLGTYLEGSLADAVMRDGRIHCTFTPNKREDSGTVTGRFSCSKPNLQQIPARDKATGHSYGQAMRSLFLPESGCMMSALDYSQIEYLLLAHFATGRQAEWLREQARAGVDFHTAAMAMTGIQSRKVVKTFNYGVIYGMGWRTAMQYNYTLFEGAAEAEGLSVEAYTQKVYNNYHAKLPVIRDTMDSVQSKARRDGYVTTLGGRRQHVPKPYYDKELGKWNDGLYKMLNKLIQGSAADILKFSLLDIYKSGALDVATMHLTVHDENVFSIPYSKAGAEANAEIKRIMETSFGNALTVPMKCDCELGPNWGYWEGDIWEEMKAGKFDRARDCWWGGEK